MSAAIITVEPDTVRLVLAPPLPDPRPGLYAEAHRQRVRSLTARLDELDVQLDGIRHNAEVMAIHEYVRAIRAGVDFASPGGQITARRLLRRAQAGLAKAEAAHAAERDAILDELARAEAAAPRHPGTGDRP